MIRKGSFCSHLPRGLRNFVVHQSPTGGALATRNGNEGRQREALLRRAYVGQGAPCRQGRMPSLRLRRRLQNGVENVWAGRLRRNWDCGLKQPQGRACRSSTCSAFWPQALCLGWRPLGLGFSRASPLETRHPGASRAAFARLARSPAADQGCWDSACRSSFLPGVRLPCFYFSLGNGRSGLPGCLCSPGKVSCCRPGPLGLCVQV